MELMEAEAEAAEAEVEEAEAEAGAVLAHPTLPPQPQRLH